MQLAQAAPRCASRRMAAIAAAVATMLLSSTVFASPVGAAVRPTSVPAETGSDAPDGTMSACVKQPAFKAVIVVGPVGNSTSRFITWADQIASAAKAAGMQVCKVYSPYADSQTVKAAARGADLFVLLSHGNGYPKPNRNAQDGTGLSSQGDEGTAHGLGLNAKRGSSTLKYYGADWVTSYLRLAPNAIVLLSHMCFSSGNSEDYDKIPAYELAVDHIDNYAQGFLASDGYGPDGARVGHPSVVMALQSQSYELDDPKGNLFKTLMTTGTNLSMDGAFRKTYSRNGSKSSWFGSYLTSFGFVGSSDFFVTTRADGSPLRSPGKIHVDPDLYVAGRSPSKPTSWDKNAPDIAWLDRFAGRSTKVSNPKGSGLVRFAYGRSITGDLGFKLRDWQAGATATP
jgi:hypothetical protein